MVLVPKGTPVHEKVAAKDLHLPTVLGMLRSGSLTGYARFTFSASEAILLFQEGKLSEALLEEQDRRLAGIEAVDVIFDRLAAEEGRMDVYRLAPDVAISIQALLHGEVLFAGQSLGIVDIRALLDKVKKQRFTGCLRIYTDERTALIFYKAGFLSASSTTAPRRSRPTPTASQNIAKLPGAKLDALATRSTDELVIVDLLAQVDVKQRWADACAHAEETRAEGRGRRRRPVAAAAKGRSRRSRTSSGRSPSGTWDRWDARPSTRCSPGASGAPPRPAKTVSPRIWPSSRRPHAC